MLARRAAATSFLALFAFACADRSNGSAVDTASSSSSSSGGDTGSEPGLCHPHTDACTAPECPDPWAPSGPGVTCDVKKQNCPDGQKCVPWSSDGGTSWNATKCVPVADNPGQVQDPCTTEGGGFIDSCDVGLICVAGDAAQGACVEFCSGSSALAICKVGEYCVITNQGELTHCFPTCDPLLQDCGFERSCLALVSYDFSCADDISEDEGQEFDPCSCSNECDPGFFCDAPQLASECDPTAPGCCLAFCDLAAPVCAGAGAKCLPWYEMGKVPVGFENVGKCVLPG